MNTQAINIRYSELAESGCCLSCGGAINFARPRAGEVCVDLGSGRGNDVLRLAESVGETGFVYGIDISSGMIEKAKKNAAKFNTANVKFILSDLGKIELPSETASLVISNCTINHASDKQAVWNEVYRILKKGGRFVVSDIYAVEEIDPVYKNDPQAVAECWAGAITRDEYMKVLSRAGFKGIMVQEESAPYEKGRALVASITISGFKPTCSSCC